VTLCYSVLVDNDAAQAGDLYIRSITFSPDCKYLATGAEDRQIRVSIDCHVSGSGDKTARIWDMATGSCVFDLRIEDMVQGEIGPIDAGITSVAREHHSGGSRPCTHSSS
jgi:glucose repression regulatory protein TUP1